MSARRPANKSQLRELRFAEIDFREACARAFIKPDELLRLVEHAGLDRAIKEKRAKAATLALKMQQVFDAGRSALPLIDQLERVNEQLDALWTARYGEPLVPQSASTPSSDGGCQ